LQLPQLSTDVLDFFDFPLPLPFPFIDCLFPCNLVLFVSEGIEGAESKMRKTGYVVTIVVYGFIEDASIWMMT
jgi:hypothetical protein